MSDEIVFLDTNVLVYLFDEDEPAKRAIARALFRDYPELRLSTQVLQEFYVAVTRKLARPLLPQQGLRAVENFLAYPVAVTRAPEQSVSFRQTVT